MVIKSSLLFLMMFVSSLYGEETTLWNGTIEVTETHVSPVKSARDLDQLRDLVEELEFRILKRRAQYKQSHEPERRRIQSDIYALEEDLRSVRIAIGGSQKLNKTVFYLYNYPVNAGDFTQAKSMIRADLDGGRLVAKWQEGLLRGRDRWGRFDGALPLVQVELHAPTKEAGEVWAGEPTKLMELTINDTVWRIEYVPTLPNPWAGLVTTDVDKDTYPYQFARIPGLPVRCTRKERGGGEIIIAVTGVDSQPLADDIFTNP